MNTSIESFDDRHLWRRRSARAALGVCIAAAGVLAASPIAPVESAPAPLVTTGGLRVVHGLPGVVADLYLDNEVVIQSFSPQRSTDVLAVSAGPHTVDVRLAGVPATEPPMLSSTAIVEAGQTVSKVLHLSSIGTPAVTSFVDDGSPVAPGQTRVIVRHTAAAPPIDVLLSESPIALNLANPGEVGSQVAAGTYQVAVTVAGTVDVLAPAQDVPFAEGTSNDMYLIGNQAAGTLTWIAVQTSNLQSAPTKIQTGDSGLAATNKPIDFAPTTTITLMSCAALMAVLAGQRRRSRTA